jgi:membrane protein
MLIKFNPFLSIFKRSYKLLRRTEPLILSSSTAFFATFSLSPILILLVSLYGLYFKSEMIRNQLFGKISSAVGSEAAAEIESIVNNFMQFETTWWMSIAGSILFLFIATTLLNIIKQNIHKLWCIRKKSGNIKNQFEERMKFAIIIILTGLLFLLSIVIDSALAISLDYLQTILPKAGIIVVRFFNIVFALVVITIWFMLIFKILPQAIVEWDVAFNGGFITAVLFYAGRYVLGKVLIHARIESIFGASASIALLMLFIFYASFILYYGAAFTHEYGEVTDKHIRPSKHAQEYEQRILDGDQ